MGEHLAQPLNSGEEDGGTQAEEDDAGVPLPLAKDEFAEIAIIGDQDAALGTGNGEDLRIW